MSHILTTFPILDNILQIYSVKSNAVSGPHWGDNVCCYEVSRHLVIHFSSKYYWQTIIYTMCLLFFHRRYRRTIQGE